MTSVTEAIDQVRGFVPHPMREMMMGFVYEALLAVHLEACDESSGNGYNGPWSYCGKDWQIGVVGQGKKSPIEPPWYCEIAKKYLPDHNHSAGQWPYGCCDAEDENMIKEGRNK